VHIKCEQPQVLSPDSHVTIDENQKIQTTELWVWRYYTRNLQLHKTLPVVNTDIHENPLKDPGVTNTKSE